MSRAPRRRADHPAQRAVVAAIVVTATLLIALPLALRPVLELSTMRAAEVRVGGARVAVTIADTPLRRARGLQGRTTLDADEGMLFAFDEPGAYGFSRRSVPFDLDVIFATRTGHVVGVATLDAQHPRAKGPQGVSYVLEVPAGWAHEHGVSVQSRLALPPR